MANIESVKVYFDTQKVEQINEIADVKILMLKGEKGDLTNAEWGNITGTLSDQTDLQSALNNKANTSDIPTKTSDLTNDSNFVNETQMTSAIGTETTNRQNADINLQGQIDAITVSSDVVDVVGTYTDLQNYDTTHIKENDLIKVLQDSTHNNAMSYYRWVTTNNVAAWNYVGSEGPFYTKAEADTLLTGKQDTLTAGTNVSISNNVISATDTTYTAGTGIDITNNVISNTQTSAEWGNITGTLSDQTDLNTVLTGKQATLVSGTNIKTINNTSLLGSGDIDITNGEALPVGSEIEYEGSTIPTGWEQVSGKSYIKLTLSENPAKFTGETTIPFDTTTITNGDAFELQNDGSILIKRNCTIKVSCSCRFSFCDSSTKNLTLYRNSTLYADLSAQNTTAFSLTLSPYLMGVQKDDVIYLKGSCSATTNKANYVYTGTYATIEEV